MSDDFQQNKGAMMYLGNGEVTRLSTKKRINGKRFTEDELIGMDDTTENILRPK